MPTLEEVARVARVSRATVSAVLRDAPYARVSPRTRSRIRETAAKLGYRPHQAASSLAARRTHNIGFAVSSERDIASGFHAHILAGILEEISGSGYSVSVHTTLKSSDRRSDKTYFLEHARRAAADGYIIFCSAVCEEELLSLYELHCPFVLIDRHFPDYGIPSIVADYGPAGERLVEHLAGSGYDPILVITESNLFPKTQWFSAGCMAAAQRLGCSLLGFDLFPGRTPGTPRDEVCIREILDTLEEQRWAILSAYGPWWLWAVAECGRRGWRVPDQVGMAALGVSDSLHPMDSLLAITELTSWDFSQIEMGRTAARTLLRMIAGEEVAEETVITGQLIERGSTRSPSLHSGPGQARQSREGSDR